MSTTTTSSSSDAPFDASKIAGNAPLHVKQTLGNPIKWLEGLVAPEFKNANFFGKAIYARLRVTEISVDKKVDEESKLEGRVIVETVVEEDMLNGGGNIHGGCSAFLVDMCSAMSLNALSLATTGKGNRSVSQAINMIYHSPAGWGDTLRLVNTSTTLGNRVQSCRTEIWNATHHRLVASGTHIKMSPSPPPKSNL
ncbi:hypothetical protein FA13DRAFT_1731965 [Coprinellus micaceus]|uniref:Thioesterase domain-containing protein n=1 Tax=Coprinellus micaceus TaxID=71717 RepID=A0A4Y7TFA6_COPMI|nr:hypothetical protein FA13DRAFT_1731965 [Coprinellus micaceus]